MSPKISVIVPVFNTEKYLRRCIDSILSQTFTDFELLLIDDGCMDASGAICDEYAKKDTRVRTFHKENGGVSSARNLGLDEAKGEWITFADSDDWVGADWLEIYEPYLEKNDTLIAQGLDYNTISDRSKYLHIGIDFKGDIKEGLLALPTYMFGSPVNKLFFRNIIEQNSIKFDKNIAFREDEVFMLDYCYYVTQMVSISSGSYKYLSPSQDKSYQSENFYSSYSLLMSGQKIYGKETNQLIEDYIRLLTNAYFNAFDKQLGRYLWRTKLYLQAVNGVEDSVPTSKWTSYLIKTGNTYLCSIIFYVKSAIKKIL